MGIPDVSGWKALVFLSQGLGFHGTVDLRVPSLRREAPDRGSLRGSLAEWMAQKKYPNSLLTTKMVHTQKFKVHELRK